MVPVEIARYQIVNKIFVRRVNVQDSNHRCLTIHGGIGLTTDICVFTILIGYQPRVLLMRLFSLAAATLVTWRLNRALTFDQSGRRQHDEAMRYAAVTAASQGTSYAVFATLVLTVLGAMPQAALLAGAAVGAIVGYNGHRLFAFAKASR